MTESKIKYKTKLTDLKLIIQCTILRISENKNSWLTRLEKNDQFARGKSNIPDTTKQLV